MLDLRIIRNSFAIHNEKKRTISGLQSYTHITKNLEIEATKASFWLHLCRHPGSRFDHILCPMKRFL